MKQRIKKIAALFMCVLFVFTYMGEAALAADKVDEATETVYINVTYGQTEARTMLDMINEFRTGEDAWEWNSDDSTKTTHTDLEALAYDYNLEKVAMQRAAELALSFAHTRPNGETCWTAYSGSYTSRSENIAAGYTTAKAAFEGWQETNESYSGQGHRRNMLSSKAAAVGIGHVYFNGTHYWVQEFGNPNSGTVETAANDSKTTVAVEVLLSDLIYSSVSADPASLEIVCGQSENLPVLSAEIQMKKVWPENRKCAVIVKSIWSIADEQYASVSSDTVTGVQAGSTTLMTNALGKEISVPLTVKEKEHIHTYGDWIVTKEVTCMEAGLQTRTCSICGESETETIEALGHTVVKDEAKDPTCTEPGLTEGSHCSVCGAVIEAQEKIPAIGHSYEYIDNGDGTHTAICVNDDDSYVDEHTYVNGICICKAEEPSEEHIHNYDEPVFTWSDGNKTCIAAFTCKECGDAQIVECTVTSETTPATEKEDGQIVYTATVEFNSRIYTDTKTSVIPATGSEDPGFSLGNSLKEWFNKWFGGNNKPDEPEQPGKPSISNIWDWIWGFWK